MHPVTVETTEPVSQGRECTIQLPASFSWRKIPRDRITLDKVLGEGEFGMVVKGELTEDNGQITPCAVKKLKRTYIYLISGSRFVILELHNADIILTSFPE